MKTPYQNLFLIVLIITGIPFFISGNSNDSDINNLNQIKNNTYDFAVPDQTRIDSHAGEMSNYMYHGILDVNPRADIQFVPALGTHKLMTAVDIRKMYGDIPLTRFRNHDHQNGVVKIGEIKRKLIRKTYLKVLIK